MKKPVSLECGHAGCLKCLNSIATLGDNANTTSAPCPLCRATFNPARLQISINLDKLIKQLEMKCTNSGCKWEGRHEKAREHGRNCPKATVKCKNNGCNHTAMIEEMESHSGNCDKKMVTCGGCRRDIVMGNLPQHQETECYYSEVNCPLGCGNRLPR